MVVLPGVDRVLVGGPTGMWSKSSASWSFVAGTGALHQQVKRPARHAQAGEQLATHRAITNLPGDSANVMAGGTPAATV